MKQPSHLLLGNMQLLQEQKACPACFNEKRVSCQHFPPPLRLPLNTDYTLLNNHLYSVGQLRSTGWDPLPSVITPWEWAVAA